MLRSDRRRFFQSAVALLSTLASCVAVLRAAEAAESAKRYEFAKPGVTFLADFPGARLNQCTQVDPSHYQVLIRPETSPINDSPWYAFAVCSKQPRTIEVLLSYEKGSHRYVPKISHDRKTWMPMPAAAHQYDKQKKAATLKLEVGPQPLWVAAQEMFTLENFQQWMDQMCRCPLVKQEVVGKSLAGRPIPCLRIGQADARCFVMIIGRQHPPEITGTLGSTAFVEALAADDPLARQFRDCVQVTVVPVVNPDGVEAGNWRCNLNKVDLNRDWVKFAQPETSAVRDEAKRLVAAGRKPLLWLDFHSTRHDVFYTQTDQDQTDPPDFTKNWLAALAAREPDYKVNREASAKSMLPTSARFAHQTFGIPGITYEWGDATERTVIRHVAQSAAAEMMRLLLPAAK